MSFISNSIDFDFAVLAIVSSASSTFQLNLKKKITHIVNAQDITRVFLSTQITVIISQRVLTIHLVEPCECISYLFEFVIFVQRCIVQPVLYNHPNMKCVSNKIPYSHKWYKFDFELSMNIWQISLLSNVESLFFIYCLSFHDSW